MSGFGIFVDVLVVGWALIRQPWTRPVPYRVRLAIPAVLFALGVIVLARFGQDHPIDGTAVAGLAVRFAVGAVGLGLLAGLAERLWLAGPFMVHRGTWQTVGLWILSLAVLFSTGALWSAARGPADLAWAALLAYVGVFEATQRLTLDRRAAALRRQGAPIDVHSETVDRPRAGTDQPGGPPVIDATSYDPTEGDRPDE